MNQQSRKQSTQRCSISAVLPFLFFLVAVNLRPPITSVGPLLEQVGNAFSLGESALGFLGSAPLLAFAVFSPLAPRLGTFFGIERAVFGALMTVTLGILIRSYAGLPGLIAGTALIGFGVAVCNVLVPALVKQDFSDHVTLATAIYTSSMTVVASVASATAVPIAGWLDWRASLALWALPAALTSVLWLPRIWYNTPRPTPSRGNGTTLPVHRSRDAWMVTLFMGLQSTSFYTMITWLPTIVTSTGASASNAGIYLSIYQFAGLLSGFAVPYLMEDPDNQVKTTVGASLPIVV